MKNSIPSRISKLFILFTFLNFYSTIAQDKAKDIVERYQDYTEAPREIVYMHLNKSTYIKGEYIGFTAYVLNKNNKKLSLLTKNLYVSIEDQNQNIIKQKLLKVQNGIVSNIIDIDSSFTSGYYTIKAYTNWMRNFNEQNYFIEYIKVIDTETEKYIEETSIKNEIDAQFLPEGGHILNGINNTIGVVLKDKKGFGIPNAKGSVYDNKGFLVTEFEVNHLGIGRFPLLAELGNNYNITIRYLNKTHNFILKKKIEPIGITLSIVQHRDKAIVAMITNEESLKLIKHKIYQLTIHNGNEIEVVDVSFDNKTIVIKAFDLDAIPSGTNIFTLFNENNKPIIERLFFNYNGINILKSHTISIRKSNDSAIVNLNFKKIDPKLFHNFSVSILPKQTKSYNSHHNILTYNFLQPYIKGTIENAPYYFSEISEEKKLELDNLLITQGWSSYDWNNIFINDSNLPYSFEQGIMLKANISEMENLPKSTYMIHSTNTKEPTFFEIENKEENYFFIDSLFPNQSERLYLSVFDKNNTIQPPKIYLQAIPNSIPRLYSKNQFLKPKDNFFTFSNLNTLAYRKLNNIQELEEVVVEAELDKKKLRLEKLQKGVRGRVKVIDERALTKYIYISDFLAMNGYKVKEDHNSGTISISYYDTIFRGPPAIYLDGFIINDATLLFKYAMDTIDYIILDKSASYSRNGGRRTDGAIRIYSYPGSRKEDNRKKNIEYKFPLTFSPKKKFYVPKYRYYNDDFFKGYGTIDWKPELSVDANGNITLKIAEPEVPVTLFIEGIANDGSFIFEEKSISLN